MYMEFFMLGGLLAVASNPSPYYAALGLVGGSGVGCLILVKGGVSFLSLILFLIYLGGMMVVFAYCAALVAEPHPEAWGSREVMFYFTVNGGVTLFLWGMHKGCSEVKVLSTGVGWEVGCGEWGGIGNLLCGGGWLLFLGGWALFLTLFVVLEVVRGYKWGGTLRAV